LRVVWLTLNPKRPGKSSISFWISVPFPTPEGPHITIGRKVRCCGDPLFLAAIFFGGVFFFGFCEAFYFLRPKRSSLVAPSGLNWKLLATRLSVVP
jgi:hypothetical protein